MYRYLTIKTTTESAEQQIIDVSTVEPYNEPKIEYTAIWEIEAPIFKAALKKQAYILYIFFRDHPDWHRPLKQGGRWQLQDQRPSGQDEEVFAKRRRAQQLVIT